MKLEVFATRQLSYGVSCPFGFRSIGVYDPLQLSVISLQSSVNSENPIASGQETVSGIDVSAAYVAKFGQLTAGMKIFVKVRLIMGTGEVDLFMGGSAVIQPVITN